MLTRSYKLTFLVPAFLSNAEQNGQWRTPPIKALLRQWWRVAYSADHDHDVVVGEMRRDEGALFGTVEGGARQSRVQIRLSHWGNGRLRSWDGLEQPSVHHREVERTNQKVGPHAYLGFGPLDGRGGTRFRERMNAALDFNESAVLSLAFPDGVEAKRLMNALSLMSWYGSLGGRNRNGWGSFTLTPASFGSPALDAAPGKHFTRPWRDALALEWPHAIGSQEGRPLIWQTSPCTDWKSAMRKLAEIKIGLRTQKAFDFKDAATPAARHWIAYPVTNHNVRSWDTKKLRLPNSLRFKLRPTSDGKVVGVIFHMPCFPPAAFEADRTLLERVWEQVHAFLDNPPAGLQVHPVAA